MLTPNFHVTVTDSDISSFNDDFDHYCLLFAGKLNYFGSEVWEQHALPYYERFIQQCKEKKFKVTCKFIVYENDELLSGHICNRLSGFGNIYSLLFETIANSDDIQQIFYPHQYHNPRPRQFDFEDIAKYGNIVSWLMDESYDSKIVKEKFEEYCKNAFCDSDSVQFYYVENHDEILNEMKEKLESPDIKSVYGFGQHFQVGTARKNYPDMFDDLDDNAIIFKVRYDGTYFNATEHFNFADATSIECGLFKNIFYSIGEHPTWRNFFLIGKKMNHNNFNIYNSPTVMYTRQLSDLGLQIHSFPHDISLIFNKVGIERYANYYTNYILDKAVHTHDVSDTRLLKTNNYLGLNIHSSLGMFFNDDNYNQIDFTPLNQKGKSVNYFGSTLREMELNVDGDIVSDKHDDYKLKWYRGGWGFRDKILGEFEC